MWLIQLSLLIGIAVANCRVSTSSGLVDGICGRSANQYLGIPYALPPVNGYRFREAQPQASTQSEIVGDTLAPYCPQYNSSTGSITGNEDCLYLNVYAPANGSSVPVMVWIHGGSFIEGGSRDAAFNGTFLASEDDVIVVTVNYRLGILGFFDSAETGTNFAMSDIAMALQWVQDNIESFGGDPDKVTLFGESSGGTMVRHALNSPKFNGLFSRAIIQSDPQFFTANSREVSRDVLGQAVQQSLGCSSSDCLRTATVEDILATQVSILTQTTSLFTQGVNPIFPWGPNIDYDYLPSDVDVELASKLSIANPVDLVIGTVKDEVASFYANSTAKTFQALLDQVLQYANESCLASSEDPHQIVTLATKLIFQCPAMINAMNLASSAGTNVYMYEFTKGIEYPANQVNPLCGGDNVCHEDDLYVTFGTYSGGTPSEQVALSDEVRARWSAFASTGQPNTDKYGGWQAISGHNLGLYLLGSNQTQLSLPTCSNVRQLIEAYWAAQVH
uniref:Carboxylic ester hydrolase n=1 Tax=Blastobotrys adeninivorans TaxID=409370 RepID=A0A060T037_BLAAD